MGEKNDGGDGTVRGAGGGGGGKAANDQKNGHVVVVLKMDLHCGGCEAKIDKFLKRFPGVEKTKVEGGAMKVTVEGRVDPAKLREKLQEKTKKKVELVSPLPKKVKDQANNEKKEKPKEPPVTTVVLKFSCLHCEGCIQKIRKIITKTKGVLDVAFDRDKDTATVRGAMDAKALAKSLREQMKRAVEIVPPKKEKEGSEAKGKEGGRKNENVGGGGGPNKEINGWWEKVEGQRMEYQGPYGYGYGGVYWEPMHLHAPQLFSDENPNACSVM
ncbi:heavy metal-associated isoprenylated plant protein 3 [Syzygium oleosum]|uniref:heavy metal-associated isoprenylated plant protein 3 n=1 Tax=Syzygium oleosum TaxID=219896 RepID=UPI0011D1E61E|nr:heavy metal-associated isoprenylated plant protein 3 [Syzygium oleosum]